MSDLFIADLHLDRNHPYGQKLLARYLDQVARGSNRLFILGDLFNFWIGPAHLENNDYRIGLQAIRRCVDSGCQVHYVLGNRDMHVRREIEHLGVKLHLWSSKLSLGGRQIYLTHGDMLCTSDLKHMIINSTLRCDFMVRFFTSLPEKIKYQLADSYVGLSNRTKPKLRDHKAILSTEALMKLFDQGYDLVICGHLHKSVQRTFTHKKTGRSHHLYCLDRWTDKGNYMEFDGKDFVYKVFE